MNDRHNRIAGCQAAVDRARLRLTTLGQKLGIAIADLSPEVEQLSEDYRAAEIAYAEWLDDLADALRR